MCLVLCAECYVLGAESTNFVCSIVQMFFCSIVSMFFFRCLRREHRVCTPEKNYSFAISISVSPASLYTDQSSNVFAPNPL